MNQSKIARKYLSKVDNAKERGIEFNLSLMSFINIFKAKKCYYTGLPLTESTITIDRIDSRLGYVKGNVVACHQTFNQLKGMIENPSNSLNFKNVIKGLNKV